MFFIDGTNLLVALTKELGADFQADKPPHAALEAARDYCDRVQGGVIHAAVSKGSCMWRRYWFASYTGTEEYGHAYAAALRELCFEPVLFKRRNGKEKGVDIALTKELLINAFHRNVEFAVLFAGDEDYLGLVTDAKRYGVFVAGAFFKCHGLSEHLRLSFDDFVVLDNRLDGGKRSEYATRIQAGDSLLQQ
jgi:uncharacterized LabA/DUF88 family protein